MTTASLDTVTFANTRPFVPPLREVKVVKTYDGDTITVAAPLCGDVYRFSVRIKGIDCPEMKSADPNEKTVATKAKEFVQALLLHQMVTLEHIETEKYGRLLAEVWYQGQSVATLLVNERLAVAYDGGHKTPPSNWLEYWAGTSETSPTK